MDRLLTIMARLRDPEGGCPWDLQQDFRSISPHTIEEAYEVDEAIARDDLEALRDELGDLLFQVVFQARLAEERGAFDFSGVVEAIVEKLVRRHPHVFAEAAAPETADAQRASWEEIKATERAARAEAEGAPDPFAGIPRRLPALARSAKVAGRMERLARERPELEPAAGGPRDPAAALMATAGRLAASLERPAPRASGEAGRGGEALREPPRPDSPAHAELSDRIGEGLRAWVQVARALGVDPEQALRRVDDATIARVRADPRQAGDLPGR